MLVNLRKCVFCDFSLILCSWSVIISDVVQINAEILNQAAPAALKQETMISKLQTM